MAEGIDMFGKDMDEEGTLVAPEEDQMEFNQQNEDDEA